MLYKVSTGVATNLSHPSSLLPLRPCMVADMIYGCQQTSASFHWQRYSIVLKDCVLTVLFWVRILII